MLFVDRASVPPPPVLSGSNPLLMAARSIADAHFGAPYTQRQQTRFKFDAAVYASRELRDALAKLFHGKCAYCESTIGVVAAAQVDRFRPRTFATSLDGVINEDHYWWLAYEWSNLYPSCAVCSRHKGRKFPVRGPRAETGALGETLAAEGGLLIDPCCDDPDQHLGFDDSGMVAGRSPAGQVTIDILNLNRPELVDARRRELAALLEAFAQQPGPDGGWIDACRAAIADPGQPYLGAKRQLVAREMRKRAGLRGDVSVERIVSHLIEVAGGQVPANIIKDLIGALPSVAPLGSQLKRLVAKHLFKEKVEASFSVDGEDVDPTYFAKTRLVESVEIKDFRKIERLRLDFTSSQTRAAPWTMLLGENGVGKSSILQAIALTLIGGTHLARLCLEPAPFIRKGARQASVEVRLTNLPDPVTLRIHGRSGFTSSEASSKVLVLAYGATRLMPRPGMSVDIEARNAKVDNLFNPFVPVGDAEEWLLSLPKRKFDDYARALKELFLVLEGPEKLIRRGGRILVTTGAEAIPLGQLSDGYQSVVGVTADIMRIMSRYWDAMEVAEGLVLIDELGSHLHPRWRMRVVSGLRMAFPRVQFIASTHDPLCLRGLEPGEVTVLREDDDGRAFAITDVPPVDAMTVEQLLTSEHFGLHSTTDPVLDARFEEYLRLRRLGDVGPEQAARRDQAWRELDQARVLGKDRRERMMLEVIDGYLAGERNLTDATERRSARVLAKREVARIWRTILPEPLDPGGIPGTGA